MSESIFDVDVLRAALGRLDIAEVARRTAEVAEEQMPGCAWLDATGALHFAETMSEVDGLMLCQAREPDEDDQPENCYWVGGWIREVGLREVAERLDAEFLRVLSKTD